MNRDTLNDLATHFGAAVAEFSPQLQELHASMDLSYTVFSPPERDRLILETIRAVDADTQRIGAPERTKTWLDGWGENLHDFTESGDLEDVTPKFIRPHNVVRLNQDYVKPTDPLFEKNFTKLIQRYIFDQYASQYSTVYEFGCGSGYNLVHLAQWYPQTSLYGTDFVQSSVYLIKKIAITKGFNLRGRLFYMIKPDSTFKLEEDSCVFTFGAIEQLAGKFEDFLSYLINNKVSLCFHIEPTVEFYDENILVDYLAIKFHKQRGYTEGLVPHLKKLEKNQQVEIQALQRFNFGSRFMEGYSLVVWKPIL